MAKSLQEQLLQAGLVDKNKARKAKSDQRKQNKQQRKNNAVIVNESQQMAEQKKVEKIAKDLELNRQQQAQKELKAVTAQVTQLINKNSLAQDPEGHAFNFNDQGKIKTLYISDAIRSQLTQGKLAIVKQKKKYTIVPAEIAGKISTIDEKLIIVLHNQEQDNISADDPYAQFQVPDDLIW